MEKGYCVVLIFLDGLMRKVCRGYVVFFDIFSVSFFAVPPHDTMRRNTKK